MQLLRNALQDFLPKYQHWRSVNALEIHGSDETNAIHPTEWKRLVYKPKRGGNTC
jgi:hypothetical protein